MSFDIFKSNMDSFMKNPNAITKIDDFADKLTTEYDSLIRRGYDSINQISIADGNVDLMKIILINILTKNLQQKTGESFFVVDIGEAIKGYWTGAKMNTFPIPITPAIGAIQNILTNTASVTNTGEWKPETQKSAITNDSGLFLDQLISFIKIHLTTVGGMYLTISLYPPSGTPSPGSVNWSGYSIPENN
jgi:hypothetical protein